MVRFFNRLSMFWKIFLPTNLIILLGVMVTFTVLASSGKSKDFLNLFYGETLHYNLQLSKLDKLYNQYNLLLLKHLAAESAEEMDEITREAQQKGRSIENLVEFHNREHIDHEHGHTHRNLVVMTSEFIAKAEKITTLSSDFEKEEAFIVLQEEINPILFKINDITHADLNNANQQLEDFYEIYVDTQKRDTNIAWGFMAISLLVSASVAFLLARSVTRHLQAITSYANQLGSGDFGARLDFQGRDEFGALVGQLNSMGERLENSFGELRDANRQLEEQAKALEKSETMLKARQDELEKAKKVADKANMSKGEFLANMSHEIRTPLSVIIGMNRLVLDTDLTAEQQRHLTTVQQSSASLLNLINDILDFSKIEAGQLTLEARPFNLAKVLESIRQGFEVKADEKGLSLSTSLGSTGAVHLIGDDLRLHQVLVNLVGNAIKFTRRGSVSVVAQEVADRADEVEIRFSVIDTGPGIPPEAGKRIFESFKQADNSITRLHGGSGLGLAICKKLTEILGGRIWLESEPGKGSTFQFTVSFQKNAVPEATIEPDENQPQDLQLAPLDILLVEDNRFNLELARIVLEKGGHRVTCAMTGLESLKMLSLSRVDVIVMDVQMPEMDGITATEIIRACERGVGFENNEYPEIVQKLSANVRGTRTPIAAMTAHAMSGDREKCLAAGMDGYITKPFQPDEVVLALKKITVQPFKTDS